MKRTGYSGKWKRKSATKSIRYQVLTNSCRAEIFLALCLFVDVRYNHEKNELLECSLCVSQASLPRKKSSIRPSELLLAFFLKKTKANAKS